MSKNSFYSFQDKILFYLLSFADHLFKYSDVHITLGLYVSCRQKSGRFYLETEFYTLFCPICPEFCVPVLNGLFLPLNVYLALNFASFNRTVTFNGTPINTMKRLGPLIEIHAFSPDISNK